VVAIFAGFTAPITAPQALQAACGFVDLVK
jgi:hypothetical protein